MKINLLSFSLCLILQWLPASGATLTESAPLRVGVTSDFPPLVYKEGGQLAGVEVDYAKALGEALNRPVKFVELNWEDQIPALTEGRTDIIMSGLSFTRARQLRVAFTAPYLTAGQTVLVRREDANKYALGFPVRPEGTIGVLKATTGDFLVQQEFPRSKRKEFKDGQLAAKALMKKQIDLLICDSPVAWWLAGMYEAQGLVVVPILLSEEQIAWAVRKSDAELLASANQTLEKLQREGRSTAILKRWLAIGR